MHVYHAQASCMYDYHRAIIALHDGSDESGVLEMRLSIQADTVRFEFLCNFTQQQIRALWQGENFPDDDLIESLAPGNM